MKRSSGILLNITSLYSGFGVGDFGPGAFRFADFLYRTGQQYWQVLALNRPTVDDPHCPYSAVSAFAGDPLLISPAFLYRSGLLEKKDIEKTPDFSPGQVNFRLVSSYKNKLFSKAYKNFRSSRKKGFEEFCDENRTWVSDFAMFSAFRDRFKTGFWNRWPAEIQSRNQTAVGRLSSLLAENISFYKFLQFIFFKQWTCLRDYCTSKGIQLIGDVPIYVAFDSADVWANREFFKLDRNNKPRFFTGTPPDDFCKTGQVWGNPVYDWSALKKAGFSWWMNRIGHNLKMFDLVRIDHFRGFISYWQVPASNKTAKSGRWVRTPRESFFAKLFENYPARSIIVENLGFITPAVNRFVKEKKLCGMNIMQWGMGKKALNNPHCLKNHISNSVVYTGTHDNNTLMGWFQDELDDRQRAAVLKEVKAKPADGDIHWRIIEHTMRSKASLCIIPMQDILGLSGKARMNTPGTVKGNWQWQMTARQITPSVARNLAMVTAKTKRGRN